MRHAFTFLIGLGVLGMTALNALGQDAEESIRRLTPPLPGAKPLEVKERIGGFYSAVSKLKNTDTRDGIGVRWNWPKELGNKNWGAAGTLALVAFPDEHVAFGKHRGFALRLVNRGKGPVAFEACDSAMYIVQEARDDKGRWREIEDTPCSWCGNSYHQVTLAANEYWEFAAPAYQGAVKTKIRFRLDAGSGRGRHTKDNWIYSNEFDGAVSKAQFFMGAAAPEVRRAFASKNAKDEGVVATLIELLTEEDVKGKRFGRSTQRERAAEHLAELGPDAKDALPVLRLSLKKNSELRAMAAYAIWRIDGKADESVQTVLAMLAGEDEDRAHRHAAWLAYRMGPAAKDAVPALCQAIVGGDERTQEMSIHAVAAIRKRADIAVPALVKALTAHNGRSTSDAAEALGEFGAEAKPAVPALTALLGKTKDYDRIEVAFALWKIGGKADIAVPVLIDEIKTGQYYYRASRRLGEMGPAAKAAVPILTQIAENGSVAAAGALWAITNEPEPALTNLVRVLKDKDAKDPESAVVILAEMGPKAKAAVPALLAAYKRVQANRYSSLREEIEAALRKIDPEAAKKAGIR